MRVASNAMLTNQTSKHTKYKIRIIIVIKTISICGIISMNSARSLSSITIGSRGNLIIRFTNNDHQILTC